MHVWIGVYYLFEHFDALRDIVRKIRRRIVPITNVALHDHWSSLPFDLSARNAIGICTSKDRLYESSTVDRHYKRRSVSRE